MREIIEQKLTELSAQKEELLARLNAVIGAAGAALITYFLGGRT